MVQRIIEQEEMTAGSTPGERIRWARMQKGWLIKTLANKAGITPENLSNIERKAIHNIEMKTLRKLSTTLGQPIWWLGCFENMPEDTFWATLEKARCYHGHTKAEMASKIGVHVRTTFNWKHEEPNQTIKEKVTSYCKS